MKVILGNQSHLHLYSASQLTDCFHNTLSEDLGKFPWTLKKTCEQLKTASKNAIIGQWSNISGDKRKTPQL